MDNDYVETGVISITPVNNMSKGEAEIKCPRPVFLSNSCGNVRSRYLREPTGSCHDLCKYGRKHESKLDEKRLTFRRFMENKIALESVQRLVKGPNSVDGKKKLGIKMKVSDTAKVLDNNIQPKKVGISDNSISNVSEAHSPIHKITEPFQKEVIPRNSDQKIQAQVEDEKVQLQFKDIVISENNINVDSGGFLHESKSIEISPQAVFPEQLPDEEINNVKILKSSKKQVNKPKASPMQKPSLVKSNIKQKNLPASTEADSGGFKEKVLSNLKESMTFEALKMFKQKNTVLKNQSESPKLQSNNQNATLSSRKENGSAKTSISLNVRTPLMRSISQLNASRSLNDQTNPEGNTIKNNEMPEVREMKSSKPQRAVVSSTAPARSAVSLKAMKSMYIKHATLKKSGKTKEDSGDIHEKILQIIEPKIDGKVLEPLENLSNELDGNASESAVSEASEHSSSKRIQRKQKRSSSKEEDKRWTRRTPIVQPADSSSSPYKLKFKRGKVIELRAADNVEPRRLRFRRGRVLGQNSNAEAKKRSIRRKRDIGDSNDYNSEAHAVMLKKANLESKCVMLKHQDTQGKKDVQALFNHVIEETASKLVETRKSKVKALVGAFETVISLQETKPASVV